MERAEAELCRRNPGFLPRPKSILLSVECKFYTNHLGTNLARSFIGLAADLSGVSCHFVSNIQTDAVDKLLNSEQKKWEYNIVPGMPSDVERLRNSFREVFKKYKV